MASRTAPTDRRNDERHPKRDPEYVLLDMAAVALRLGVTERFVRRLVTERRLPFHKIGRWIRFDPADIDAWIEARRVNAMSVRPTARGQG